ncbi:DUF3099 domain-containing protein [Arthrobacter sp. H-02-3]|uniref:DUF3099 domain-containing protein n=1 Tax=Arthrobacter sp. H-02-3 TaxID=2703675 RepID=UPI000DD19A48|nr:DUF3099 domain-containing protein [Arthrobacter sp. H-02-3]PVZ59527.1 DUF3099 domain-containing protein [Arthrobacter sp. H-02-3]
MTLKNRPGVPVPGRPDAESGGTEVHSITDAAAAHSDEMRQRMIKYAIAMGIRMVCLILIFVVDGWFKLLPVLGAVFLPWVAVVIANGSDKAEIHSDSLLDYVPQVELDAPAFTDPGHASAPAPDGAGDDAAVTLLQGELIDDENDDDTHGRAAS